MKIKFVDLVRQNKTLKKEIMHAIEDNIDDADFSLGARLEKFEREFAKFCGKKYAVGVNSGTDAIFLSLLAYGIGKNDEVITVPNSYFSTASAISNTGAMPVFVDIDSDTYTMDVRLIEGRITSNTKAIIPVHLYGQPADMDPILKLAKKYKLVVLEDACQTHGATYRGKRVPYGETGAFSFYPGKNLGAFGDAGAVVTDRKDIADKILLLRNDGSLKKYKHLKVGFKSRLDTIQAVILSTKLPYLLKWNNLRKKHAEKYSTLLKTIPEIKIPTVASYSGHIFHLYVIESNLRDKLQKFLAKKGISTVIHYPIPIHLQEAYKDEGYRKGNFPIAESVSKRVLSLPMFPELTNQEIEYVAESIREFFSRYA